MLDLETRDGITVLRMAHGPVSALDLELLTALGDRLETLEAMDYGPIILTGSGDAFSAGVDLWRVVDEGPTYLDEFLPALDRALSGLLSIARPVVAAVNGHAIAGGCVLTCACDYRIMAEGSGRIGVPELKVGVPFPAVALGTLRAAVPASRLRELIYAGRTYGPAEARQVGLVDELSEPGHLLDRAREVAGELAAIPAETFQVTKRQLTEPVLTLIDRVRATADDEVARIWADPEIHGRIRAYMERIVGERKS